MQECILKTLNYLYGVKGLGFRGCETLQQAALLSTVEGLTSRRMCLFWWEAESFLRVSSKTRPPSGSCSLRR